LNLTKKKCFWYIQLRLATDAQRGSGFARAAFLYYFSNPHFPPPLRKPGCCVHSYPRAALRLHGVIHLQVLRTYMHIQPLIPLIPLFFVNPEGLDEVNKGIRENENGITLLLRGLLQNKGLRPLRYFDKTKGTNIFFTKPHIFYTPPVWLCPT